MGASMEEITKQPVRLEDIQQKLNYYSNYVNMRQFTGKAVYALHEQVDSYLTQPFPNAEAKQKAHGNFLWMLKNYYPRCFQKEVIAIVNANIDKLDLTDRDKLNYLNYILSMKNYNRFSIKTFQYLSDVDGKNEAIVSQGRNTFDKMKELLNKQKNKPEQYRESSKRFYKYFSNYAKQCPQVTHKLVEEYTDVLFGISEKFPFENVSLWPLKNLVERTVNLRYNQVQMGHLFEEQPKDDKKQVDKKAVKMVLKKYVEFSLRQEALTALKLKKKEAVRNKGIVSKNSNGESYKSLSLGYANLYHAMTSMMCYMVKNYDYKSTDVKALRDELGRRVGTTQQRSRLYDMGRLIQRSFNETQPRAFNQRNKTIDPIKAAIVSNSDRYQG